MKDEWTDLEFADWTLLPSEAALLANKTGPTRLGFAVLLKFFQYAARFPLSMQEVPTTAVAYIARQVGVPAEEFSRYDWEGRAVKYHRAQIRAFLGFREPTVQDAEELALWLSEHVLPQGHPDEHVNAAAYQRLHDLGIEPPTPERLDRVLASASSAFEERFCTETVGRLSPVILGRLEALLSAATEGSETAESERSPRATESGSADHELGYECQASGGDVAELSVRCTRARLAEYNMETIASEFLLREEGLPPEDIFVPDEFWTHLIHRGIGEPIQACNYVITCRLEQTRIDLISHESHASSIAFSRGSLREIPLVSYWCHVPYSGPSLSYCSETAPL